MRLLVDGVREKGAQNAVSVTVVTDISASNLVQGSTDVAALIYLCEHLPKTRLIYLPRIHAKVFTSGDSLALIGSANFTEGGFRGNLEYGVRVTEESVVKRVNHDIRRYARLGGLVSPDRLLSLQSQVTEIRVAVSEEQRSIRAKLRAASSELRQNAQDDLVRIRLKGRSLQSIFADTVLYLLSDRRLSTQDLYEMVPAIHPDLCDDSVSRIISGDRRVIWQHRLRHAQQALKKKGLIENDPASGEWLLSSNQDGSVSPAAD
jgi:hypothetical protein